MMIVRAPQLRAFEASAYDEFVEEMTAYLRRFSPALHGTLGDDRMRAIVHDGMAYAARYGFTRRGPLRLFLELMLLFGSRFDEDPQYPWAGEVLHDPAFPNEMYRAGRLEHLAKTYLDQVHGPNDERASAALQRLEARARDLVFREHTIRRDIEDAFAQIFPEKAEHVGPLATSKVIDLALAKGESAFGQGEVRGPGVLAILMFSFGAGCLDDPLLPWMGATLSNPHNDTGRRRAEALERKSMLWLKAVNARRAASAN